MWFKLLQRRGFWAVATSLALCLVISGVLVGSPVQAEPRSLLGNSVYIAVVPSSVTVAVDGIFTLELWVYPNGQPVDVVDADMTFDPAALEVLSITGDPSALPEELYSAFDNGLGTLTHSRGILMGTPPTTDFRLCSIEFKAKAPIDEMPLAFTDLTGAYFEGGSVLDEKIDATVTTTTLVPVGGVARLPNPGRILMPWMVRLTVIVGLFLGAVVVSRRVRRVA